MALAVGLAGNGQIGPGGTTVSSFNTRTGAVTLGEADVVAAVGSYWNRWSAVYASPGDQTLPSATATSATPYVLSPAGVSAVFVGAANSSISPFYLDPADYPIGPAGATPLLRLKAWMMTNQVAQTGTVTVGLYPIATWSNPATTSQTPATVGAATVAAAFAAQAASTETAANSATANFPAAGFFLFGAVVSGAAIATNGPVMIGCRLQVQQA